MKYSAFLETQNPVTGEPVRVRVFPRSKKQTAFTTADAAEKRLEQVTRGNTFNSRGFIYEHTVERKEVRTVAL